MIFSIDPGTVYVGYELAKEMQIQQEDTIMINGSFFTVAKTLSESGSVDDIRIYGALPEFQSLIGLDGKINEIMALNCLCISPDDNDPLKMIREQLGLASEVTVFVPDTNDFVCTPSPPKAVFPILIVLY